MSISKIVLNGVTQIDLTDTTADATDVLAPKVFYSANGTRTIGNIGGDGFLPGSAELVATHEETINLSNDTDWDSWTPSTTSHTLLAAGTTMGAGSYTIGVDDYQDKAIIGIAHGYTDVVFKDGTTMAKGYGVGRQVFCVALYSPISLIGHSDENYGLVETAVVYRHIYWTSKTAKAIYTAASYGLGLGGSIALSVSSATATSRTVGFTVPALTTRCNSTYFSTACAGNIDSENTNTYIKTKLYLIDKQDSILYKGFDAVNGILKSS